MIDFHDLCNNPSYTIIGAHNWSHPEHATSLNVWTRARHAEYFFDLLCQGRMDVRPLVTHRAPAADAVRLYEMLRADRGQAMGVIIEW